jgi:hypothetical protein
LTDDMSRLAVVLGLSVVLLLVTAPRFDQRDLGVVANLTGTEQGGNRADAEHYVRYVEVLRGEAEELPPAPFRYRPLAPVLAAPLPVGPLTAINVVNLVALAAASVGLWKLVRLLGLSERHADVGCLLFIVSFPTFYYGTIGYVDPVAIALTTWGVWAVLADRRLLVVLLVALGAVTRESTVILPALGVVWLGRTGQGSRRLVWSLVWLGTFVATAVTVRAVLYDSGTNVWRPSLDTAVDNLTRPRTWLSATLTLGVPVALILLRIPGRHGLRRDHLVFLGTGAALCLGVFAYAVLGAYADGRFLWPIYAFTVPLAMMLHVAAGSTAPGPGRDEVTPG